jgi:hypothetical protein
VARPVLNLLSTLLRWTLWLGLAAALAFQLRILTHGGLRVPAVAETYLNRQLAAEGLVFHAEAIWLDPRGRILLRAPRAALASPGDPDPPAFASARAIALQIRRRALLAGRVELLRAEITGLSLTLPPVRSPSGASQTLLDGGEFRLARASGADTWRVGQASARVLAIPTSFSGELPPFQPDASRPRKSAETHVRLGLRLAADASRRIAALPLESVRRLDIRLAPDRLIATAEIPSLLVPDHPALPAAVVGASLADVRLAVAVAFGDPGKDELRIDAGALAAATIRSGPLSLRLRRDESLNLFADLAASGIRKTDTHLPPVPLVAALAHYPADARLAGELSLLVADAPWGLSLDGYPGARSGSVSAQGALTPALLELVRPFLPEKARPILSLSDPVDLDLSADFVPGGRPVLVLARASAGRAVARDVRFDRAGAVLRYEPAAGRLRADELLLVQDDSRATGSYEMDTKTLAFRFLLGGRLRPMGIEGWFSGWWDNLWANFAFGAAPPDAEVDIQGVWRDPPRTTVFVGASSGPMKLRELPLDTLATRLFIADGLVDDLGFRAARGDRLAEGRFARRTLPGNGPWQSIAFDVRADFPAEALPALFGEQGRSIIAPVQLDAAPVIHLVGETFGPGAADRAGQQRYTLDLSTDAPLRYAGFPLDHLAVRLENQNGDIRLENLRAGVADGVASGRAALSGPADSRWLAVDIDLADAGLDLAIARWREFQTARDPAAPNLTPDKPLGGKLSLHLAANGPAGDPRKFSGTGAARITDANLASIRLLGKFSELLSGLGIGLATLKLTDTNARFTLEQHRLVFAPLELSGPSALIEAEGAYRLSDGALDFTARVRPFEKREGIIGSTADFVLTPLSGALEVELAGTLDQPDWAFAYGPTRLFRRMTGSRPKTAPPAEPASESPRPGPPSP